MGEASAAGPSGSLCIGLFVQKPEREIWPERRAFKSPKFPSDGQECCCLRIMGAAALGGFVTPILLSGTEPQAALAEPHNCKAGLPQSQGWGWGSGNPLFHHRLSGVPGALGHYSRGQLGHPKDKS